MAKKQAEVKQAEQSVVSVDGIKVVQHLDKDLNDPRLQPATPVLASLNDADQN